MKTYIINIEYGVQIRIDCTDKDMKIYDKLVSFLDNRKDVKCVKKSTPVKLDKFQGKSYYYKKV